MGRRVMDVLREKRSLRGSLAVGCTHRWRESTDIAVGKSGSGLAGCVGMRRG